jgi:hypothetical protein
VEPVVNDLHRFTQEWKCGQNYSDQKFFFDLAKTNNFAQTVILILGYSFIVILILGYSFIVQMIRFQAMKCNCWLWHIKYKIRGAWRCQME